jgi:hypothetical protein
MFTYQSTFLKLLNKSALIQSFDCDNDSILGAGEYSFLIYTSQSLILFNVDGPLYRTSWDTRKYDSIKQIRWSSYHRAYLIMTAQTFSLFTLFNYELLLLKQIEQPLHFFTCYQTDLWLVCSSDSTSKRQSLRHYDLCEWIRDESRGMSYALDRLGLHATDTICALEHHPNGEYLALLVAERNQNVTMGVQRRRRLLLLTSSNLSAIRTVYFSGADDLYWTLTYVRNQRTRQSGWLLGKWFDPRLIFVDDRSNAKVNCLDYEKELRNLAATIDGHYLILRTVNSLDVYQID